MRYLARVAVACFTLFLASCAPARDASTPEARAALFEEFKRGDMTLACTIPCISAWLRDREQMRVLDSYGQWQPLAVLVSSTGYMKDLGYYYLGRSAEGLNLPGVANRYYRQSYDLATGGVSGPRCRDIQGDCNGVDLLAVLPAKLGMRQGTTLAAASPSSQGSTRPSPREPAVTELSPPIRHRCRDGRQFTWQLGKLNGQNVTVLRFAGGSRTEILYDLPNETHSPVGNSALRYDMGNQEIEDSITDFRMGGEGSAHHVRPSTDPAPVT